MMNSATYKLTTIKDIFDKVPAERIEDCCKEIGILLSQSAAVRDILCGIVEADGHKVDRAKVVKMPEEIEWTDDGLGELEISVSNKEEKLITIKTKVDDYE